VRSSVASCSSGSDPTVEAEATANRHRGSPSLRPSVDVVRGSRADARPRPTAETPTAASRDPRAVAERRPSVTAEFPSDPSATAEFPSDPSATAEFPSDPSATAEFPSDPSADLPPNAVPNASGDFLRAVAMRPSVPHASGEPLRVTRPSMADRVTAGSMGNASAVRSLAASRVNAHAEHSMAARPTVNAGVVHSRAARSRAVRSRAVRSGARSMARAARWCAVRSMAWALIAGTTATSTSAAMASARPSPAAWSAKRRASTFRPGRRGFRASSSSARPAAWSGPSRRSPRAASATVARAPRVPMPAAQAAVPRARPVATAWMVVRAVARAG